jgi:arylformamidase
MTLIDITVPLHPNLPVYPGNTPFSLEAVKRIAHGDSSNVSTLHFGAHSGTHVDAPWHFLADGTGADALPLDLLVGRTRVVEVPGAASIGPDELRGSSFAGDVRVLLKTRNSLLWESPAFHADYVGVTEAGARFLVEHGVKVVGVDYLSVEVFKTPGAPAHHILLGGGVIVIEGLNLRHVDPGMYEMMCLPLPVVGCDGAPARVVLRRS